jgi:hypothetical protein
MALSKNNMLGKCLADIAPVPPCSFADAVVAAGIGVVERDQLRLRTS